MHSKKVPFGVSNDHRRRLPDTITDTVRVLSIQARVGRDYRLSTPSLAILSNYERVSDRVKLTLVAACCNRYNRHQSSLLLDPMICVSESFESGISSTNEPKDPTRVIDSSNGC
jgi:hypothetical protein